MLGQAKNSLAPPRPARINSLEVRRPSRVSTPEQPRGDPELFQREIRPSAQKADNYNVAPGLFGSVYWFICSPSGEIQQNTLGTPKCQSRRAPILPLRSAKAKNPSTSASSSNSINGTRCDCRVGAGKY